MVACFQIIANSRGRDLIVMKTEITKLKNVEINRIERRIEI